MNKRQNIFQSPQLRVNQSTDASLLAAPQILSSPDMQKQEQQPSLNEERSPGYKQEVPKDQVRPSSKPNIRCIKQNSQTKGLVGQSLYQQSQKPYMQASTKMLPSTPISANNTLSQQSIQTRTSLQSPPRQNQIYALSQNQFTQNQSGINKGYQRCCPSHQDEFLKRICSIAYCNQDILLCGDCMYEDPDHTKMHQQNIILVNEFLDVVEREGQKHNWAQLLEKQKEMFSQQTQNLSQFPEKHAQEYGEYIEVQKKKIHHDIGIISQIFQQYLEDVEKQMIQTLNDQLQYVCQQLETLKMDVNNISDLDQRVYINPRGYLEHQLLVNENMAEVSQNFRWIRNILFGDKINIESQRERKENLERMGIQLINILKNPPEYPVLTKETLKEIEKRIGQHVANVTSEMRFSLSKDPNMLNQNDFIQYPKQMNHMKNNSLSKREDSPQTQTNNQAYFGFIQQGQASLNSTNPKMNLTSSNQLQINGSDQNNYSKEYLINKLQNSSVDIFPESVQNQAILQQSNLKQSTEYDYTKNKPKLNTLSNNSTKISNIQSEENVKHSSNNNSTIPLRMQKDDHLSANALNQNTIPNRTNHFANKDQVIQSNTIKTKLGINNMQQKSPFQNIQNEKQNRGISVVQNQNGNQNLSQPNIDELEANTPIQNGTPIKYGNNNFSEIQNQQQNQLYQLKQQLEKASLPSQQQSSQQSSWQQVQTILETIPELNQSSSVHSLHGLQQSQMKKDNNTMQNIEIMEGNNAISVNAKGINCIKLSQIPQDILLSNDKVNCLCVIGGALIACGDVKGLIKLYNLSSQTCIGEYAAHKSPISCITSFQGESPFIISGCSGDNSINLWNILDHTQSILLRDSSHSQSTSLIKPQVCSSQNINFISSFYDERNIVAVVNNFSAIHVWDVKDRKRVQKIKPIVQVGDNSSSQVTSILCMGRLMQSILIGYKCSKVGIYKVDYENQTKIMNDTNKITKISLFKQVDLGRGNIASNIVSLFSHKVFITVKKTIFVWDTKTFEICEKIESYQNDNSSTFSTEITDILVAQFSDINQGYSVIQTCKNDNRIVIHNHNSSAGLKHHIKDFKIIDPVFKQKLQFCKNHMNEFFIVGLNQNKNSITYWKLFDNF